MDLSRNVETMSEDELMSAYMDAQNKLGHALRQLVCVNILIAELKRKLIRRNEKTKCGIRHVLQMRLSIANRIKVLCLRYVAMKANRICRLRIRMSRSCNNNSRRLMLFKMKR